MPKRLPRRKSSFGGRGQRGRGERAFEIDHLFHLLEEPGIDGGELVDLGDGVALRHGEADVVQAVGRGGDELLRDQRRVELLGAEGLAGLQAADALPERLFEGAADGHHFAHGLHLGAERGVGAGELLEGPLGNLGDDVVDGRLEAGGRLARDVVADLVEPVADGELCGDLGDGESGGLGREGGAARDARVHLDDDHAAVGGVDGELHVRAAGIDADLAQATEGAVAHHLVLAVGERLGRGDGDGVAGVDAHGVEVFDGADDDAVVGEVAHDLELVLFPAEGALFDQDFVYRREVDAALEDFLQLFLVVGDAAARAAEREAGAQDAGVADAFGELEPALDRVDELRLRRLEADLAHRVLEEQAVFRLLDGVDLGADQLDSVLFENPAPRPARRRDSARSVRRRWRAGHRAVRGG